MSAERIAQLEREVEHIRAWSVSLAVRYHNYLNSLGAENYRDVAIWGFMLMEAQEATGVRIISSEVLRTYIALGHQRPGGENRIEQGVAA